MKKLVFLFAAVLLTAISVNVFAQTDNGITPFVGSSHDYHVADNSGSTYAWKLTTSVDGTGPDLIGSVATGTSSTYLINLTWINPVSGTTYYLHVTETASLAEGGCTNHKVLAIAPESFVMNFVTTQSSGTDNAIDTDYEVCPPDVLVSSYNGSEPPVSLADAQAFTYDYQTTYLYYHITVNGIDVSQTDWTATLTPTIAANLSGQVTASWGTYDGSTWSELENDGSITTTAFSYTRTGSNEVWLRLAVAHGTTYEGLTAENIVLSATAADEYTNVVVEVNGKTASSDEETQIIKKRPTTGVIGID